MKNISYLFTLLSLIACKQNTHQQSTYTEQHRPQLHFSPKEKWMNDPNGMVYLNGTYHLFFQYYPKATVWGPMHWGHAVSKDLIHWKQLPIALYPDKLGYIFSGSIGRSNEIFRDIYNNVAIPKHHCPTRYTTESRQKTHIGQLKWPISRIQIR